VGGARQSKILVCLQFIFLTKTNKQKFVCSVYFLRCRNNQSFIFHKGGFDFLLGENRRRGQTNKLNYPKQAVMKISAKKKRNPEKKQLKIENRKLNRT